MELKIALIVFVVLLVKFQVTSSQWTLVIQLFESHHPMNVEIRQDDDDIEYCCCDNNDCAMAADSLNDCDNECDIFFTVSVSNCASPQECFISTIDETIIDSPPDLPYGYIFTFTFDVIPEEVIFHLEMRDRSDNRRDSRLIDTFLITVNSSSSTIPHLHVGEENLATVLLSYQLRCTDLSICGSTPTTYVISTTPPVIPKATPIATPSVLSTQVETPVTFLTDQNSQAEGLQTVWMVMAILFLVIAVLAIMFCIVLGYLLFRKIKSQDNSSTATITSNKQLGLPIKEDGLDNPVYAQTLDKTNGSANVHSGIAAHEVFVHNELYGTGSQPNIQYYNEFGETQMQQGNMYEQPLEMNEHKVNPYETPLSALSQVKNE